ncbi:MAG: BREX-1 system phosphatase PglZ type B, partial [Verrucomicrobiaceae bacterium]
MHRAARHSPGEDRPACVLWTDPDGQWQPVVALLRSRMSELLTLGEWDAGLRRGPAFWLRLCVDGAAVYLPEGGGAAFEHPPVLYLPGIARHDLRSGGECRDPWKPLIALPYRGTMWTQVNARDWTVEAFLVAKDGGLGLEVARDERTRQALLVSLAALAETPVERLRNKKLESEDFDKLMVEDTPRDLLLWMSDPAGMRARWEGSRWQAFVSRCQADYAFHPDKDGDLAAGENLGRGKGAWRALWERFCEAPTLYAGLPDLMRRAQPMELALDPAPWPKENDRAETAVREALLRTLERSAPAARELVGHLEKEHAARRLTPWDRLG